MNAERIVLIDTDAGLDDTLAIIMALKAHQHPDIPFRIVGITCVHGNTTIDNVTVNVTMILDKMGITDIPVFRGAAHPMVTPSAFHSKATHHGSNGFGDVDEAILKRPEAKIEPQNAVDVIIQMAKKFPGRLTIVALGPLTNLGLAVRADDRIKNLVKEIFIMGGNGSNDLCTDGPEFNFLSDPESVHVTLTSFSCPIIVSPKEIASEVAVQTPDWRLNVLGKEDTPECRFMNLIEKSAFEEGGRVHQLGTWRPFDSTIMAALIEPNVIRSTSCHPVWMELHGNHRGHVSFDFESSVKSNVQFITDLDVELFQKMLTWTMNSNKFYK